MIYIFIFYWIFSIFFTIGFLSKQNSLIYNRKEYNILYYTYCIVFGGVLFPYLIGKLLSKLLVYLYFKNEELSKELSNKKNKDKYDKRRT